ncbi:MAG: TIR domain-containing protein, partial [Muribaculaceae bacterium]|nr:TIR domain-containing protein [Muribaculaceae bacterium]
TAYEIHERLVGSEMCISDRSYTINNSTVTLIFGDLLTSDAEVLVISGSVGLPMIGGLPGIVKSKAGDSVLMDASKHPESKLGDVVVTTAGSLTNKYIFQAVTVTTCTDVLPDISREKIPQVYEFILTHAINKSLRLLTAMELNSIAFPCLGLGMANMPIEGVAKLTAKTISNFLMRTNKTISVEIYIKDTYEIYNRFDYLPLFEWFAAYSYKAEKNKENEAIIEGFDGLNFSDVDIPNVEVLDKGHKVFISYSRKDSDVAKGICDTLNKLNITYWIDIDGVYSGANFKEMIVKAISTSEIVLFLSSENSNKSDNVAKEISIADKYGKIIIPVRLDGSPMNPKIDYDLAGIDFVDLFSFEEKSLAKLRNAILGHLAMNNSK